MQRRNTLLIIDRGCGAEGRPRRIISGDETSTQSLYVSVPSDVDALKQPLACALMLQYQGQTFPNISSASDNSTSCSDVFFPGRFMERLVEAVHDLEYVSGNGNGDVSAGSTKVSQKRCDLLASHVSAWSMPQLGFCGVWTSFASITGGPIFGPDASTTSVKLHQSGGEAVSLGDYELHEVVSMTQLFRPGGDDFPDAVSEVSEDLSDPIRGAGRQGTTPVMCVFYRSEEDNMPEVGFACMRIFSPAGG